VEGLFVILPILAVIGLIAIIILVSKKLEQKRTVELAELATDMSLDFAPQGDAALESELAHLSLMKRGRARKLLNLVRGETQNVDLALFDYQYTTGGGKNQTTHRISVVAFASGLLNLPPFELGPENFLHRIAGAFGYQDIDFAGYPRFNKKYLLRGPDEDAIRQIFTEDVVQHFEQQLEHRKSISEVIGHDNRLIVATRRQKPEHLRSFLEHAFGIFGVLKAGETQQDDHVLTRPADEG
jgi:hypothetical protein